MAKAVYLLCAAMSILCSALLFRGFAVDRSRLLLWSGVCFAGLALNNVLLVFDLVMVPQIDLAVIRTLTAAGALAVLLFGLVWELK